ncbi:uncharacterized protein LOC131606034 [Vicia villosa]|uniref:uncharacterized protein LOC131606034 n=1 Tax=Vicia villosa TaxID=3911 RepID=UPI00273BE24F|nr:uncharacterized protein LOC131606034 [Vicia villosa]
MFGWVGGSGPLENWFPSAIICKLENGDLIDFRLDRWLVGGVPLCERFPSLFRFAKSSGSKVNDNGFWISEEVEDEHVEDLIRELGGTTPMVRLDDLFIWWKNSSGYPVKVAYDMLLEGRVRGLRLGGSLVKALDHFWKTKIPSKVLVFGWRLLLDKLPTKVNFSKREILSTPIEIVCPFCGLEEEDSDHLFASCSVTFLWWTKFCDWLGFDTALLPVNIFNRLFLLESFCKSKFMVDTSWLFGMAFCWGVWNCRNGIVFNGVILRDFDTVGMIKFVAWEWFLFFYKVRESILYVAWCVSPNLCIRI